MVVALLLWGLRVQFGHQENRHPPDLGAARAPRTSNRNIDSTANDKVVSSMLLTRKFR